MERLQLPYEEPSIYGKWEIAHAYKAYLSHFPCISRQEAGKVKDERMSYELSK